MITCEQARPDPPHVWVRVRHLELRFLVQIRALDSMIKKLKSNRHKCQVAIDEDEEQLKWIAREEESIHVRLDPLAARLKEREETAARVRKQIEDAVNLFNGVRNTSSSWAARVHTSKCACSDLFHVPPDSGHDQRQDHKDTYEGREPSKGRGKRGVESCTRLLCSSSRESTQNAPQGVL